MQTKNQNVLPRCTEKGALVVSPGLDDLLLSRAQIHILRLTASNLSQGKLSGVIQWHQTSTSLKLLLNDRACQIRIDMTPKLSF